MNKTVKKSVLFLILFAALSAAAAKFCYAQPTDEYIQQQILQQQRQERDYRENIKNILELQRIKDSRVSEENIPEKESVQLSEETENIYKFDKIILSGNKIYSYKKLQKAVLNDFINKPINKSNVALLQSMLSDYYIKRGYVAVKVYFDNKRIIASVNEDTGKIETTFAVIIEEGEIHNILLDTVKKNNKNKSVSKIGEFRKKTRLFFAFPFKKGKPFNMNDFEQGIDQMNKLRSNSAALELAPSSVKNTAVSGSDVIIINNQDPLKGGAGDGARTAFIDLNYNNGGSRSTGYNVINLSVSQDNLFAVNDNIYLSYSENSDSLFNTDRKDGNIFYGESREYGAFDFFNNDGGKKKYSKSLYGAFSFPFGYWSFDSVLNYSCYKTVAQGYSNVFHLTGQTISHSYSADRVIYKTLSFKSNLGTSLEIKDSESYIRDVRSETGSARRSNLSLYVNNTIYTKYGMLIFKPSYKKGLDWFGVKTDADVFAGSSMADSDPRLQYDLVKLYVYFSGRFGVPLLTKDKNSQIRNKLSLFYSITADSQYSFDSLYGTDQFSAGGQYSVRGFSESVISGDNGFYIRSDLKAGMLQLLPDIVTEKEFMKNKKTVLFGESPDSLLAKTNLAIFYDFGYVANRHENIYDRQYDAGRGYITGCGVSLSYWGRYVNWAITYSKALYSPGYLQKRDGLPKEEEALYWRTGISW
ncbi:MAG: hypothetical protein FWH43_05940 [Endomicrobia bacterium]|nr:hypothetical protein [Endomicrobiia bacterium]